MTEEEKRRQQQSPYAVDADTLYSRFVSDRPSYAGTYDKPLDELYQQITSRPAFTYDAGSDPLFQQYKDLYTQQGKLAMKDTMGQAAALTGGYGSSYGQQVGQQTYDAYLQNLSATVPELYSAAYGRYQDEGDALRQQYALLGAQRDTEYGRYLDELGAWQNERAYQTQLENEEYNRQQTEEATAYSRQQDAYSKLYALIMGIGYQPNEEELAEAGMRPEVYAALRGEYQRLHPVVTGGGGGGYYGGGSSYSNASGLSSSEIAQIQRELKSNGYDVGAVDGVWGARTEAAYNAAEADAEKKKTTTAAVVKPGGRTKVNMTK